MGVILGTRKGCPYRVAYRIAVGHGCHRGTRKGCPYRVALAVALPKTFLRFQSEWTGEQTLWPPNAEPRNPPGDLTVPPGSDKVLTKADIWTQRQYSSPSGLAHDDEPLTFTRAHVRFFRPTNATETQRGAQK